MTKQALLTKIDTLPEETLDKLEIYIDYLCAGQSRRYDAYHLRSVSNIIFD